MEVRLLYEDREFTAPEFYYDYKNIVKDLGLDALFEAAAKVPVFVNGEVKEVLPADMVVKDAVSKVILSPLHTEEEIKYRQDIIRDMTANPELLDNLYYCVSSMISAWDVLGRKDRGNHSGRDKEGKLVNDLQCLGLFVSCLGTIKSLLRDNLSNLGSRGLHFLYERLNEEYPDSLEEELNTIVKAVSFYVDREVKEDSATFKINSPRIVLECGLGGGCKCDNFSLMELRTDLKRYKDPESKLTKVQDYLVRLDPNTVSCENGINSKQQASELEYMVVSYVYSFCEPFIRNFENFFDRFRFQTAFYKGAVTLTLYMQRFGFEYCYPHVCKPDRLAFCELKEFVMAIEQKVDVVGNTCTIDSKMLIVITGANQGGKSTFLRSIGIAQVMMQAGLMVAAKDFSSGLFPSLFMHFTRREDSEMNSGRLDEELNRMSQIIDNLSKDSMVLLNESFATTTEKDGSVIAYDIIKALKEAKVKVVTVTHLLSFARKVYDEATVYYGNVDKSDVTFFCAERKQNGDRTYKMIQSVPELTSFGLDLYDKVIGAEIY